MLVTFITLASCGDNNNNSSEGISSQQVTCSDCGGCGLPAQTYMAILPYARNAEELALIIVLMMFLLQVIVVVRIMMLCVRSVVIVLNIEAIMRKVLAVIVTTNILNIIKSL